MRSPKATQSTAPIPKVTRSIFREDAVRDYVAGQETTVLPRIVSPCTFTYLWALLGVLGISSTIAWLTKLPVYLNHEHFQAPSKPSPSQSAPSKPHPSKPHTSKPDCTASVAPRGISPTPR